VKFWVNTAFIYAIGAALIVVGVRKYFGEGEDSEDEDDG
jgi:hypothetical protein